jgi:uncharacterized membrane protein YgdD (TMEM256/DUF423 family)
MDRLFFALGSLAGLTGVAAGAFGGHVLRNRLDAELYAVFEVAARYHLYHALALLGAAWACGRWPGPWSHAAGWCFAVGLVLFSGSLYGLSLSATRWLGAITPVGGVCFMAGWLCLGLAAWRG